MLCGVWFELGISRSALRGKCNMIRPADDVCLMLYIIFIICRQRETGFLFARDRRSQKSCSQAVCATQTLAVRDTEVQSTGRSLRMRTWVGPGALCMHERASRVSHISLPQDCSNTCSERVWLALHLATPKSSLCLLSFTSTGQAKIHGVCKHKWFELLLRLALLMMMGAL